MYHGLSMNLYSPIVAELFRANTIAYTSHGYIISIEYNPSFNDLTS